MDAFIYSIVIVKSAVLFAWPYDFAASSLEFSGYLLLVQEHFGLFFSHVIV
jgi:hypothetical protein